MSDENERSVASDGSVAGKPVAWGVMRVGGRWVSILDTPEQAETSRKSFDRMENWVHEVVPLYQSPMLTDAERPAGADTVSDIVARLRRWTHAVDAAPASDIMDEAADEIARLRLTDAEREAIKAGIACCDDITYGSEADPEAAATLRALLERMK